MAKSRNPKGLGHYYKKDGLYCWKYVRDGKPIYRSSKTEKGLQTKVRQVLGTGATNDKTKVREYFYAWLEDVKGLRGIATYKQYKSIADNHILPVIGDLRMASVKKTDIQKVIIEMNKRVYEVTNKNGEVTKRTVGASTKTMKHAKNVMNLAFTKAYEDDKIILENPVYKIEIPNKQEAVKKVLTVNELAKYFKALETSRWYWSVWFALVTGLRRGELLALKTSNIDWDNRRILIKDSNTVNGLGDTKSRKASYIALTNMAIYILAKQFDMLIAERNPVVQNDGGTLKSGMQGEDFLIFPAENGRMIKPNTYYHTIVRFAEKAGVKAHPHCFRHTFTYFLRNKLSLKELQHALRHEESTSTLDLYGELINDTNDETVQTMDTVFTKIQQEISKIKDKPENAAKIINLADRRKAK